MSLTFCSINCSLELAALTFLVAVAAHPAYVVAVDTFVAVAVVLLFLLLFLLIRLLLLLLLMLILM